MTKLPPVTDEELADHLVIQARSDRDAFGELYDLIYPPIFRYCVRRVADRNLAEDITSCVFLNVADGISDFGGQTFSEFRRWVFTIATNEINASYRKVARRRTLLVQATQTGRLPGAASEDPVEPLCESDDLQAAIMELGERAQAIITMRFFSELPYEDIAHILNISAGSARTAVSRAIDTIRHKLGSE